MTTKATGGTAVMTAAGTRARDEKAAAAGALEVPERLRADYDAAPGIDPDTYIRQMATVKDDGRPTYDLWAHQKRMQYASSQARQREREAARRARLRTCPSCGQDVEALTSTRAGVGLPNVMVCLECRPLVAAAVQAHAPLPDGRTRAAAADEFAAQMWAERKEA